jgi:hypothetical protein
MPTRLVIYRPSLLVHSFQVEMAGSSIFDYVHQGDHAEVAEQLGLSLTGHSQGMASPSSSDDGTTHGTMNPDGKLAQLSPHAASSA